MALKYGDAGSSARKAILLCTTTVGAIRVPVDDLQVHSGNEPV